LIYLDSAAIVKLVRSDKESSALGAWLAAHSESRLVSSALVEVEVVRVVRRIGSDGLALAAAVLARISRSEITAAVRTKAAAYPDAQLRSLDAIHLATAEILGEQPAAQLEAFVTYDVRLAEAAVALGLPTVSPGS
jgi:uncharacterized protein